MEASYIQCAQKDTSYKCVQLKTNFMCSVHKFKYLYTQCIKWISTHRSITSNGCSTDGLVDVLEQPIQMDTEADGLA